MYKVTHHITNETNQPLDVWVEPWDDGFSLSPHAQVRLVSQSAIEGDLQIEYLPNRVMIYGWPDCTLQVYSFLTSELIRDFSTPFPSIPSGLSMKEFITLLFGHPSPPNESKSKQN